MRGKLYMMLKDDSPVDAELVRGDIARTVGNKLEETGSGRCAGSTIVFARFGAEDGRALDFMPEQGVPGSGEAISGVVSTGDAVRRVTAEVFETAELMSVQSFVWNAAYKLGVQDRVAVHLVPDQSALDAVRPYKSIEIYYDVGSIPEGFDGPLSFRNEAMEHIELAIQNAGCGEWAGAEIGMGEVNFGFEVEDFERAEEIVRTAVRDTPYEGIREITRFSYPADLYGSR